MEEVRKRVKQRTVISKVFLVGLLYIIGSTNIYAAMNVDSLKAIWKNEKESDSLRFKAINTYYRHFTFSQPDSILLLSRDHLAYAEHTKNLKEMANAYNERSYAYYIKGDLTASMEALKESIDLLSQMGDPIALASVYANIGNIYGEQNKYQDAIGYFTKTLKIFEVENVPTGEARMLTNIGLIYYHIDSYDLSLDYLGRALSLYRRLQLENKTGTILSEIGSVFYQQGKFSEAVEKADSAELILVESNNKFALADCYFLKAKSYLELDDREKARVYVDKSLLIDQELQNNSKIIERLTFDAELYFDEDIALATQKAEDIVTLLKTETKNELKVKLYDLLHRCYKAQNRYDSSLRMLEQVILYSDSLEIQKSRTAIVRKTLQDAYEDKLSQSQIAYENTQTRLRRSHLRKIYFLGVLCMLIITSVLLYSRTRILASHKKRDQLLEEVDKLKNIDSSIVAESNRFQLDRSKIESFIDRKLNETDWKVLNILLEDPVISNKDIAKKAIMSVDGIGSSLRRMYEYFDIKESKYKKISLLMLTIKLSSK